MTCRKETNDYFLDLEIFTGNSVNTKITTCNYKCVICSLIKMLYWMCQSTGMELTGPQLQHAIKRNFGGLDSKDIDTEKIFRNHVKEFLDYVPNLYNITDEMV